jgi:hypothetical protein
VIEVYKTYVAGVLGQKIIQSGAIIPESVYSKISMDTFALTADKRTV